MMNRIFSIALFVLIVSAIAADCQNFNYEPRGRRDPFVPLIGQEKAANAGLVDITSVDDIRLEGMAVGADGRRTAIMNGEIVREGFKAGDLEVKKIDSKSVLILISGKEFKISLPEEGGPKIER